MVASSGNGRDALDFPASDPRVIAAGGFQQNLALWDLWPNCPAGFGLSQCGSAFTTNANGARQELVGSAQSVLSTTYPGYNWSPGLACGDSFPGPGFGNGTGWLYRHVDVRAADRGHPRHPALDQSTRARRRRSVYARLATPRARADHVSGASESRLGSASRLRTARCGSGGEEDARQSRRRRRAQPRYTAVSSLQQRCERLRRSDLATDGRWPHDQCAPRMATCRLAACRAELSPIFRTIPTTVSCRRRAPRSTS